jgi:uncharacterized RDD family membrane protein YckC
MQRAYWDDDVSVLSAENVFFEIETAGLAARFGAALLDIALQLFVVMLVSSLGMLLATYVAPIESWSKALLYLGGAIYLLFLFFAIYAYYFFFEWLWDGQTPGKRALRLRVMQTNGMPITYWHAFLRNVIRIADFLPAMYGVGAVVGILDSNNRRVGDLLAGTIVARERSETAQNKILDIKAAVDQFLNTGAPVEKPQAAPNLDALENLSNSQPVAERKIESGSDAEAAAMLRRLDAQDYELARDFLLRREKLAPVTRARLAASLAARLFAKLGDAAPDGSTPDLEGARAEEFLQAIVERLRGKF